MKDHMTGRIRGAFGPAELIFLAGAGLVVAGCAIVDWRYAVVALGLVLVIVALRLS